MEESSKSEYVIMPWDDLTDVIFGVAYFQEDNEAKVYSRWELIQKMLNASTKIKSDDDLIRVIKSYNTFNGGESKSQWKLPVLKEYFAQLSDIERNQFFEDGGVLSLIRNLAFLLRELVPRCEILKTGFNSSIKLHQIQVASILANAFLCTFPKGKADCPSINFNTLFEGYSSSVTQYCVEKIKCIVHYFKRLYDKQPTGMLTFQRYVIPDHKFPRWDKTTARLCSLKVDTQGKIEDQIGYIHMDFSNRYVGGGVLGRGCVQEEIRFVICPELIAARLFTECLADNESLSVVGAERYCTYTGYSSTFAFAGDYKDTTPIDSNGHRRTYLTIIDALYFHQSSEQYRESKILRELKKAYVGFKQKEGIGNLPMATGNWGCGAFGGDPQLKSLLQMMASSQARRDMLYLTFGDSFLKNQMEEVYLTLKKNDINVGELYRIIRMYNRERRKNESLFEFILASLQRPEKRKMSSKSGSATALGNGREGRGEKEKESEGPHYMMDDYKKLYTRAEVRESGEEENALDVLWYEDECGSSSGAGSVRSRFERRKADDEEVKSCPEAGTGKGEERKGSKKLVQPKITDFF